MTHTTHDTTHVINLTGPNGGQKKNDTEVKKVRVGPKKMPGPEVAGLGNTISRPACVRSRNWFLTINNYTQEDINIIISINCNYVFQEEQGESGTKHIQGVLMFKNARTFTSIKKILPRAHIEICKDVKSSIRYCCKSETRIGDIYANISLDEYREEDDDSQQVIEPLSFEETIKMNLMKDMYGPDEEFDDLIKKISF